MKDGQTRRGRPARGALPAALAAVAAFIFAAAVPALPAEEGSFAKELSRLTEQLDFTMKILAYGLKTEPVLEGVNEGNEFEVADYRLQTDVRPDFFITAGILTAGIKPRFNIWREKIEADGETKYETDSDLYVNEWLIRLALNPNLFASYMREDLQWGPSYLLSPSNPFHSNNGQNNPKQEVPGMDYLTMVWSPSMEWTVSLIANVDNGRRGASWNADEVYRIAVSEAEEQRAEAQAGIDQEISDALDNAAEQREEAIKRVNRAYKRGVDHLENRRHVGPPRPHPIDDEILRELKRIRKNLTDVVEDQYQRSLRIIEQLRIDATAEADAEFEEAVATFDESTRELREFRPTYALKIDWLLFRKYVSLILSHREGDGLRVGSYGKWDATDAIVLYAEGSLEEGGDADLLAGASYTLSWGPTFFLEYYYNGSGESYLPLDELLPPFGTIDVHDLLLRRNYALFQFIEGETFDRFDLALRWIFNLDDNSNRLIGQALYDVNDWFEFFLIAGSDHGGPDDEFGGIFDYSVSGGVEFFF